MPDPKINDDELTAAWETVVRGVVRTHQWVLEHVDLQGKPAAWFEVLHLLLRNSEQRLPMTSLARQLSMTTGGFTKLADRMAHEGLIDREPSSDDRRVVFAVLTPEGLRVAQLWETQYREALRTSVLRVLTPAGFATLADGAALLNQVRADPPTAGPNGVNSTTY